MIGRRQRDATRQLFWTEGSIGYEMGNVIEQSFEFGMKRDRFWCWYQSPPLTKIGSFINLRSLAKARLIAG
ncbi:MAG: hypothetical protein ACK6CP_01965 [Pseudanabaena sp.]